MHELPGEKFRQKRMILASSSPRRRDLLERAGFIFDIISPDCDENVSGGAREITHLLSIRKARAVKNEINDGIIIAADTLVSVDGQALGKPEDDDDAARMLTLLGGRAHEVVTGVCVLDAGDGRVNTFIETTVVYFRPLSREEIGVYVSTGEPRGKAGSYAIQGGGAGFIEKYEGDYTNIVGLPIDSLARALNEMGY